MIVLPTQRLMLRRYLYRPSIYPSKNVHQVILLPNQAILAAVPKEYFSLFQDYMYYVGTISPIIQGPLLLPLTLVSVPGAWLCYSFILLSRCLASIRRSGRKAALAAPITERIIYASRAQRHDNIRKSPYLHVTRSALISRNPLVSSRGSRHFSGCVPRGRPRARVFSWLSQSGAMG